MTVSMVASYFFVAVAAAAATATWLRTGSRTRAQRSNTLSALIAEGAAQVQAQRRFGNKVGAFQDGAAASVSWPEGAAQAQRKRRRCQRLPLGCEFQDGTDVVTGLADTRLAVPTYIENDVPTIRDAACAASEDAALPAPPAPLQATDPALPPLADVLHTIDLALPSPLRGVGLALVMMVLCGVAGRSFVPVSGQRHAPRVACGGGR